MYCSYYGLDSSRNVRRYTGPIDKRYFIEITLIDSTVIVQKSIADAYFHGNNTFDCTKDIFDSIIMSGYETININHEVIRIIHKSMGPRILKHIFCCTNDTNSPLYEAASMIFCDSIGSDGLYLASYHDQMKPLELDDNYYHELLRDQFPNICTDLPKRMKGISYPIAEQLTESLIMISEILDRNI